mmetsp:Transcript_22429/g.55944  ORF Transcript_22429/g.55944 Transcript_22429/m.55944 type:complete len:85 (+) Transcript_22429:113-367(+)
MHAHPDARIAAVSVAAQLAASAGGQRAAALLDKMAASEADSRVSEAIDQAMEHVAASGAAGVAPAQAVAGGAGKKKRQRSGRKG